MPVVLIALLSHQVLHECVASLTSVLASQGAVLAPLSAALCSPTATLPAVADNCVAQLPDAGRGVLRTLRRMARALQLRRMLADTVDEVSRAVVPEVSWVCHYTSTCPAQQCPSGA